MEIILGLYLAIAGVLYGAHKDGAIADDTTVKTYQFEAKAAEINGDKLLADYLNGRLEEWQCK